MESRCAEHSETTFDKSGKVVSCPVAATSTVGAVRHSGGASASSSTAFASSPVVASRSSGNTALKVVAYLVCALIWGTTWYGIRVCIGPGGYAACPAAALRFTISTLFLAVVWLCLRKRLPLPSLMQSKWIVACGLISGISYGLLYLSEQNLSGGIAAVLSATSPIMAAVLASFTKTERLSRATIAGLALALIGVAIVFHDRLQISAGEAGAVGLMLINCAVNATSNVGLKGNVRGVAAIVSNTIFFFGATVTLWFMTLFGGQCTWPTSIMPTISLLYLSLVGTVLAFALYFYLLKNTRLSTAMSLSFVTPIVALIVDGLYEKHAVFSTESFVGIGIVLAGVVLNLVAGMLIQDNKHTL